MARGTWQGSGTWQTGSGPDPGVVVAILMILLIIGGSGAAAAITSALVTIAVIVAAVICAAIAALFFIWRATRRREARYAASQRHRQAIAAPAKPQVAQGARPAIEQHVHYHYHAPDGQEVTPQPIPGKVLP